MPDGIIKVDTPFAKEIGFTSDLFSGYLWRIGNRIMVSLVQSVNEGRGNLSKLFSKIEAMGLSIAVPTPIGRMQSILERKGFVPHFEYDDMMQEFVEVWTRPLSPAQNNKT